MRLVTNYGDGGGGGQVKFYPYEKGGGTKIIGVFLHSSKLYTEGAGVHSVHPLKGGGGGA